MRKTGNRGDGRFPQRDFNSRKTFTKPDFGSNVDGGNNNELKKQLEILNAKMDRLTRAVEAMANPKPLAAEVRKETAKTGFVVKAKKIVKNISKKKKK